ncbi:hypothetical protein IQ06DRAFT_381228 [Phaeosphaeriaceae sp. SRC1lsM3a]|nr:hypothetical protein IQ06DRAFT_381228 [Stagonospora sp. SRC1lsM3a]
MTTAISFRDLALSPLLQGLRNVHHIISKGQAHAAAQSHDPNDYLNASLHPDMKDFIYQIQRFTDAAKFAPVRVNPANPSISLPDTEKTFEECLARVEKVIKYLESIEVGSFEGREKEEVVMKNGGSEWKFTALEYVMTVVHPNFWFHVTTTYAILRMKGVDIGKMDFLKGKQA